MQLLHDTNRDLYLVYTRWGHIGEDGMNQRTPFDSKEKAIKEFHKIFKEKTANLFENVHKYERVEKKFNLTKIKETDFNYKELLKNFNWKKTPKCKVNRKIKNLIKSFAHPGYYRDNMNNLELNTNLLPISGIKDESITEAKEILEKIQVAINKDVTLSKDGLGGGNYAEKVKVMEEIYSLSNNYYEIIPTSES